MLKQKKKISERSIERLSIYRRYLKEIQSHGKARVYSHELAKIVSGTAAQVRRDLMEVGCTGCSSKGYEVESLITEIGELLDCAEKERIALIGVGNLGRAVLGFFSGKRENFEIVAVFDKDPEKTGRVVCGRRCYPLNELETVFKKNKISTAIIAVPSEEAQEVAQTIIDAGVRAIINFAPTLIQCNNQVYVDTLDMTMAVEKAIYFSRSNYNNTKEGQQ